MEKGSLADPALLVGLAVAVLVSGLVWWTRERGLRAQREMLRSIYSVGEEILGASSAAEILKGISTVLPRLFRATRVRLYLYNRGTKTLDSVADDSDRLSVPLDPSAGSPQSAAATCFQNRTLLVVPNTRRSPFTAGDGAGAHAAGSLLFVPMFAQGNLVGILEIDDDKGPRDFGPDEQVIAQHLANQIGLAIQLLEQRSIREQLFRSEKLAAMGRLISGVVNELQAPLAAISSLSDLVQDHQQHPISDRDLNAISAEARRASDIVTRLVSFARAGQGEVRPVEINGILRGLIEFRERECKARGIHVRDMLAEKPLFVLGSHGQLEQVFLNLFVHAEQSLAEMSEKEVVVRTSVMAKRVLTEISYSGPDNPDELTDLFAKPSGDASGAQGLEVCRSIIAEHGGEIRLVHSQSESRFELELAWEPMDLPLPRQMRRDSQSGRMTALLIEPDESVQRQLITLLSSRGYRVVPVNSPEEGGELVQRLRFELAICSIRLPGLNWVQLFSRIRRQVRAVILVSEAYDSGLAAGFQAEGCFVLSKPIDQAQFDLVVESVEAQILPPLAAPALPLTGTESRGLPSGLQS